mmetsp:Transcript_11297/g.24897  ORF Transcript_11297/g.24897 Transcript_11297/m.24897 type:complete len:93 (+) Transcript_11297:180-458(+)
MAVCPVGRRRLVAALRLREEDKEDFSESFAAVPVDDLANGSKPQCRFPRLIARGSFSLFSSEVLFVEAKGLTADGGVSFDSTFDDEVDADGC